MLRVTVYEWDGEALVVESEEVIPNPDAGADATPAASL
jgi:hypothetical protein